MEAHYREKLSSLSSRTARCKSCRTKSPKKVSLCLHVISSTPSRPAKNENRQTKLVIKKLLKASASNRWNVKWSRKCNIGTTTVNDIRYSRVRSLELSRARKFRSDLFAKAQPTVNLGKFMHSSCCPWKYYLKTTHTHAAGLRKLLPNCHFRCMFEVAQPYLSNASPPNSFSGPSNCNYKPVSR